MNNEKGDIPYSKTELFRQSSVRRFKGKELDEIAFPLGGIGTGCISLGGWGQLSNWEIFNRPNKGFSPDVCFFALYSKQEGGKAISRLIRGPQGGSFVSDGHGRLGVAAGLPSMQDCVFTGMFPIARIDLLDPELPLRITIEAFNPFIPLDEKNSSIPVAIFLISLQNISRRTIKANLLTTLDNITGYPETGGGIIEVRRGQTVKGIMMTNPKHSPDSPRSGSISFTSPHQDISSTAQAIRSIDAIWEFWRSFEKKGIPPISINKYQAGEKENGIGGLLLKTIVNPKEIVILPIFISWHSPISDAGICTQGNCSCSKGWKTYSATLFKDAWDVAEYVGNNLKSLEERTRLFVKRFYGSTLPGVAVEAAGSQISILKSPTCLRFEDGNFWGWEGVNDKGGCCEGTCMHVWNYAQALPYLYPSLARSVHDQQFNLNMAENGRMCFRQPLPPGTKANITGFHAAADGQLGAVMRVYREWLISGDDEWLRKTWPKCKKALEYAWLYWDADKDGVMEGVQHNTYDNEFWGPNTMLGSIYLGALRAGEEMVRYLGDENKATEYHKVFESGRRRMEKNLFNGYWYRQIINPKANEHTDHPSNHLVKGEKTPRYQYGEGCLSDQLIGQWYAEMLQLGYLFNRQHVRKALKNIFNYNWFSDVRTHPCFLREYALSREAGLVLCTWTKGGEPPYPFGFATEVWCGIEYQVASHLIYEGFLEEGLAIVKGVRDRHNGTRRNPWDEFECGHHYSRSMASYALILALSGFQYKASERKIGFIPRISSKDFGCFFSVGTAWGFFKQKSLRKITKVSIEVDEGSLPLREIILSKDLLCDPRNMIAKVGIDYVNVDIKKEKSSFSVRFGSDMMIKPNCSLQIHFQ